MKRIAVTMAMVMAAACGWARDAADFAGHYVWTTNAAEAQVVAQEIDTAIAGLNFLIRPIGRPKLTKSAAPYPSIDIAVSNGVIRFVRAGAPVIEAPANGTPVKWAREEGAVYDVTFATTPDGRLQQTFSEADGVRTNVFTLADGGRGMTMQVTIGSRRLSHVLAYTLSYVRH